MERNNLRIITPTGKFPDPHVAAAARPLGLTLVSGGRSDMREEVHFEAPDGSSMRYLRQPELEIPLLVLEGASAESLRNALADRLPHVGPHVAAAGFTQQAPVGEKMTVLRILSAHSLETVSETMIHVATLAARDPSPHVRIGVVQMLQYAPNDEIAGIVRAVLANDADPDVREFARAVLELIDAEGV